MNKKILKSFALVFIWDNPDFYKLPDGTFRNTEVDWNSRKVIFGVVAIASFILTIISIVNIWGED